MAKGQFTAERDTSLPIQAMYARYAAALNRYLARRVRRPEDVEDLTQEIFELFVRRKDRTEVVRNPLAYLFRIAFHVVGTALAEQGRAATAFDLDHALTNAELESRASSSEEAEELATQQDVHSALAQLPENYLTALMLIEGQGMSYKDAARVSGFTPGTIATYVTHGRAALKLALEGRGRASRKDKDEGGNRP